MSLQVCHCGWSKVTTYHGLRTHQGIMGCTSRATDNWGNSFQTVREPAYRPPVMWQTLSTDAGMSLQVCHCGWSKVTTYHGLRTHQGKMGCTSKATKISEGVKSSQKNSTPVQRPPVTRQQQGQQRSEEVVQPSKTPERNSVQTLSTDAGMSLQVCHCGWSKVTTYHGLRTHQGKMGCMSRATKISEGVKSSQKNSTPVQRPPVTRQQQGQQRSEEVVQHSKTPERNSVQPFLTPVTQSSSYNVNPVFETQSQLKNTKVCRALDFSSLLPEAEQLFLDFPATTVPETPVPPKETDKERKSVTQTDLKVIQDRIRADLQHEIQMREQKIATVTASEKAAKVSLDAEWLEVNNVFLDVMRVVEDAWQKALLPLDERKEGVKREAQDLIQELQTEINKIHETINELDKTKDLQDLPQTGLADSQDWMNKTITSSFSFGSLKSVTSKMMEHIQQELDKLSSLEIERISSFAVDVKLDPLTAHACLVISPDGKTVRDGGENQNIPNAPERFDTFGSILGLNVLTSGKAYWEVEVGNKTGWDIGVARRNANRKGKVSLAPQEGFWAIVHYQGKYAALAGPAICLPLTVKPQKVGVFMDYEEGLVSFYDVTAQSHIYSFTKCSFKDEILPYFSPHLKRQGKNSEPLIISAV